MNIELSIVISGVFECDIEGSTGGPSSDVNLAQAPQCQHIGTTRSYNLQGGDVGRHWWLALSVWFSKAFVKHEGAVAAFR